MKKDDLMMTTPAGGALPRGIRNNNPGNIRRSGDKWVGLSSRQDDPAFARFDDPVHGLRALMKILLKYRRDYGLYTVRAIIGRWAPPSENDTGAYADAVAKRLEVGPDDPISLTAPSQLILLARAIAVHENGHPPPGWPSDWYDAAQYERAVRLAGM